MFLGTHQLSFTGNGRVVLPKGLRSGVEGKEVILSRGLDGCIWGFDKKAWVVEAEKQLELPITAPQGRRLRRYIFSAAQVVAVDGQGRFVIPRQLLDYAQIKDEVYLIGAGDHFEIWEPKRWLQALSESEER